MSQGALGGLRSRNANERWVIRGSVTEPQITNVHFGPLLQTGRRRRTVAVTVAYSGGRSGGHSGGHSGGLFFASIFGGLGERGGVAYKKHNAAADASQGATRIRLFLIAM